MTLEVIGNYSLLYYVKGSNSSLTPYMLCSHLDVVPAEPQKWTAPPFAANIIDGYIYARGTIDFKHGLMVCSSFKVELSIKKIIRKLYQIIKEKSVFKHSLTWLTFCRYQIVMSCLAFK